MKGHPFPFWQPSLILKPRQLSSRQRTARGEAAKLHLRLACACAEGPCRLRLACTSGSQASAWCGLVEGVPLLAAICKTMALCAALFYVACKTTDSVVCGLIHNSSQLLVARVMTQSE